MVIRPVPFSGRNQLDRLNNRASQLFSTPTNQLVLGIDEGIPLTRLPDVLKNLEQCFPHLQVECLTASSPDISSANSPSLSFTNSYLFPYLYR